MAHPTTHLTITIQRAIETGLMESGLDYQIAPTLAKTVTGSAALNIAALSSAKASQLRIQASDPRGDDHQARQNHDDAFHSRVLQHMERVAQQIEPWTLPIAVREALSHAAQSVPPTETHPVDDWARRISRETAHEVSIMAARMAAVELVHLGPTSRFQDNVQQDIYRLLTTAR